MFVMARLLVCGLLCVVGVFGTGPRLPVPEFDINLDLAPEDRFVDVIKHFNTSLWSIYGPLKPKFLIDGLAMALSSRRGPENDELQAEIRGIAKATRFPVEVVHVIQMIYELNTLMVPIENFTWPWSEQELVDSGLAAILPSLSTMPLRFGCTGIVAKDSADGSVYHARNLDFSLPAKLQPLTYIGVFKKGGQEVFRAQSIIPYQTVLTGMRKGPNGYTVETNTRFPDHKGGNTEMLHNTFSEKRVFSGWLKRKVLEDIDNYEDAVRNFSTTPIVATEFNIMSGVKKGTVLARNPDGLAYQLPLAESKKNYIISTNFDYIWHDIKELFDPTSLAGFGKSRRKAAQAILDKAETITPELLYSVMNNEVVVAKDTLFQAFMNVETGLWNVSLPACKECGRDSDILLV